MYSLKEERISTITPFSVLADNKRIRNKIIEGKSVQDGTPTPEAPVEIQNLGDEGTVEIKQTGISLVDFSSKGDFENDVLTASGTNRWGAKEFDILDIIKNNAGKTMYFSCESFDFSKASGGIVQINYTQSNTPKYFAVLSTAGKFTPFQIPEDISDITRAVINVYYNNSSVEGTTYTTTITKPMLSFEENAEYEIYKNKNYVLSLSQPLRSLPNGTKDTIEEDGTHRRVGSVVLDGSENYILLSNNRYQLELTNSTPNNWSIITCMSNVLQAVPLETMSTTTLTNVVATNEGYLYIKPNDNITTVEDFKSWLSQNPVTVQYQLREEVIEPFDEEQQAVINSMETFEGVNHFSLVGDLETTLTFDYNPQITEEIKRAFKYNITKAYLEVAATDKASGFQINEDNYLQSIDFDDCRYIEGEGIIGSCVAKELQGKFVNVDSYFDIENKELDCFIGAETKDNITHYLRLGTFIVQKPENDNVKDNTNFYSLDYMIKFNVPYVHRMAKYFPTKDEDILQDKQYYTLSEGGEYIEVTVPKKDEISTYYEVVDEYTLMELLKDICDQSDVKLGTFNFRNADYVVHGNRFDSGVTCRDVLKAIAQAAFSWARINEYNELLLDFETSDTITEKIDYNEYYNLSFNDKYGPVNTIVMKDSQAEGENITIKNDELINSAGGKNKLDLSTLDELDKNGIIAINNNGTITLNGTATDNSFIATNLFKLAAGTYTMSANNPESVSGNNMIRLVYATGSDIVDSRTLLSSINANKSFTLKEDVEVRFQIRTNSGTTYNNFIIKPQLEEGPVATNFEAYTPLGTKELAISDNPFAYSEETRRAIIQAGEAIYGFNYVPLSVSTIGAAYLNCKDKLKIKNMQDKDVETYVFDTRISYQGSLKSDIETLAMTDVETKYRYDGSLTTAQRRTEFKVDKAEQKINSLILVSDEQGKKMTDVEQTLEGVTTKIEDTTGEFEDRFAQIENTINGISTQLTTTGGQNLLRNSVGYFGNEYWDLENSTEKALIKGNNSTEVKQNSVSGSALEIQNEMVSQTINEIKNGFYVLTFSYKRIVPTAIAKLIINNKEIDLYSDSWKEESNIISVTENQIKVSIISDLPSSVLITDLILSEGTTKAGWSQNANESYTDNVQIGKGVRITATGSDTEFLAEASGITINNTESGTKVAEFTKYGTETQELIAHKDVKIADSLLIQKIGEQTWFSSL